MNNFRAEFVQDRKLSGFRVNMLKSFNLKSDQKENSNNKILEKYGDK